MSSGILYNIMNFISLDIGQKKVLNDVNKISLAKLVDVLRKPIRNRVMMHSDVLTDIFNTVESKYANKVEEELCFLAESDQNNLGAKYEALKGNAKILHSKGNSVRMFVSRETVGIKVLAVCKVEAWHADESKVIAKSSHRANNWKEMG